MGHITDIEGRKRIAIKACKGISGILMDNFGKAIRIRNKGDRDLVTDIDKKAEKKIIELINKNFPEDNILAEESYPLPSDAAFTPLDSKLNIQRDKHLTGFRWIIDPIDGTHNFIHDIGIFGTSIALEFKKTVVTGVIYMPCTDELYIAQKGKGAYCNGKRITVSKRKLREATMVYDSGIRYNKKQMLNGLNRLVDKIFNVRMFGSTARSLTYLAEGKVDIEIEFNDKVWDFAAGLLLVEEAGGKASDFKGKSWNTDTQGYIASNGIIHKDVLKIMKNSLK